jgi:hypothetical protein
MPPEATPRHGQQTQEQESEVFSSPCIPPQQAFTLKTSAAV